MKLTDIRTYAIRQQVRVRFSITNGMECIINEHGISKVPLLNRPPDFNLEQEFSRVSDFTVEPVAAGNGRRAQKREMFSRAELEARIGAAPSAAHTVAEHDE
ncbi:MAG: hypothetical protein HUU41_05490 [Bryobacteraceae bacterium]|nr:hypothetical protein [Bryobacterales bacterium]MEB2361959.1 hypothetical protein [Bryobacterales bacterium]NUN00546.1 hypothetical protein [Bryobacteraceae bacterium]